MNYERSGNADSEHMLKSGSLADLPAHLGTHNLFGEVVQRVLEAVIVCGNGALDVGAGGHGIGFAKQSTRIYELDFTVSRMFGMISPPLAAVPFAPRERRAQPGSLGWRSWWSWRRSRLS